MRLYLGPVLAVAVAVLTGAAAAPAASADVLLAPVDGGRRLTADGGWIAWSAPVRGGGYRLVTRAPDGTVTTPAIRRFGAPPDASIGTTTVAVRTKRTVAVYSRCAGSSAIRGCDLYQLDLATGTERRLSALSTSTASEVAPSVAAGTYAFARRGGRRPGTYTAVRTLSGGIRIRRIDARVARETATSGPRVAYLVRAREGRDELTQRQADGDRPRVIRRAAAETMSSVVITRYRIGWLQELAAGPRARVTNRIEPGTRIVVRTSRALPASTDSLATDGSRITMFLDRVGVQRAVPPLFA